MSSSRTCVGGVAVLLLGLVGASSVLATTACKCQDAEPKGGSRVVKLTAEQQQALNVDRVRFDLKTPEDYAKEAYLAIDEDNVQAEFEALRRAIEAEVAAPSGVSSGATPAPSR